MRIRQNSEFATLPYLKEVCILNQNPWDILCSWTDHQSAESQIQEGTDEFRGHANLNSENELVVHCSKNSSTSCSHTRKRSAKRVNRRLKRKKVDSTPGDDIVYYAGFPGLRRKRGPLHRSEAASEAAEVNNVDESH